MYRRGRYYSKRRLTNISRSRQLMVVVATLVLGLGGALMMTKTSEGGYNHLAGKASSSTSDKARGKSGKSAPKKYSDTAQKNNVKAGQTINGTASLPSAAALLDLASPAKKEIAMRLVSSAENSSLDWRAQFSYIEDIGDGRGYTAGIIGFCSGTGDMLQLVEEYTKTNPNNLLAPFLPALKKVNGTDSHVGLGSAFEAAWKLAAKDLAFQQSQEKIRDEVYFKPALAMAKTDGLNTLGQFIYYDAAVMHGPDAWGGGLPDIRAKALASVKLPSQGGDEKAYLQAFLTARKTEMAKEAAHRNLSRISDAQEAFLHAGNLGLDPPLNWKMYGDSFSIQNSSL
jgi:chitosanase